MIVIFIRLWDVQWVKLAEFLMDFLHAENMIIYGEKTFWDFWASLVNFIIKSYFRFSVLKKRIIFFQGDNKPLLKRGSKISLRVGVFSSENSGSLVDVKCSPSENKAECEISSLVFLFIFFVEFFVKQPSSQWLLSRFSLSTVGYVVL